MGGGLQKTKSAPLQIIRTLSACVAARLISQNLPYVKRPISATSVMISLFIPLSEKMLVTKTTIYGNK